VPRRGAFVAHITKDDLIDHYRIYASISMIAAERAAEKLDLAGFENLSRNVEQMRAASTGSDREKLNTSFTGSSTRLEDHDGCLSFFEVSRR